jgi:hypothetical protein
MPTLPKRDGIFDCPNQLNLFLDMKPTPIIPRISREAGEAGEAREEKEIYK